jgi:ABC-type oligopeptide transport system substrate-binding subunit
MDIAIIEQIVDDWHSVLGVNCTIEPKDLDFFIDWRKRSKFDLVKVTYGGIYCDPAVLVGSFGSWETKNYGRWNDTAYDDMVFAIDKADDILGRAKLIERAELYLAEEMPIIPLFFKSSSYLIKKDVIGWFKNSMNIHPMKFVYFGDR